MGSQWFRGWCGGLAFVALAGVGWMHSGRDAAAVMAVPESVVAPSSSVDTTVATQTTVEQVTTTTAGFRLDRSALATASAVRVNPPTTTATTTTTTTTTLAVTTTSGSATTTTLVVATTSAPRCHPSYVGACLLVGVGDYDCAGGSGNGPNYTGPVQVVGPDEFDLDRDHDGLGCESS